MSVYNQYEIPNTVPASGALQPQGGNTIVSQGNLQSPVFSSTSGYSMSPNGDATFRNLTASGRLTVTAGGVIGGFDVGSTYLRDTGNTFGLSSSGTIRFWAGETLANIATAPLRLTAAGALYASSADITGKVTSTSGAIAGWTTSATEFASANNKIKLQSTAERILVGDATAPLTGTGVFIGKDGTDYEFRVGDPNGKYIHFDGSTGFTMNGMYLSQAVLASLATGTELSVLGWQFTGVFSSTDYRTVAWTAGTLTFSNGESYAIDAGNTGAMAASNYIYFSYVTSQTVLQKATTYAAGAGKILIAFATPNADTTSKATFFVYGGSGGLNIGTVNIVPNAITTTEILDDAISTAKIAANAVTANEIAANTITASQIAANTITASQIAANTITASQIAASTITGNEIAANTITANKMTVSTLSAIAADLGTITAGNMTVNASGYIKGGQSGYNSGTGFWLGYDSSAYKFSIGTQTNYLLWNGTSLLLRGAITYSAGDLVFVDANTERSASYTTGVMNDDTNGANYTKLKEITLNNGGIITVSFDHKAVFVSGSHNAYARIYKNGTAAGTERATSSTYTTYTENLTVATGDKIQIYAHGTQGTGYESSSYIKNFKLMTGAIDGSVIDTD